MRALNLSAPLAWTDILKRTGIEIYTGNCFSWAFFLALSTWSLSSGVSALIDTLNQACRIVERRPWWRVRLTATVLTLALTAGTMLAFGLIVVGPPAGPAGRELAGVRSLVRRGPDPVLRRSVGARVIV